LSDPLKNPDPFFLEIESHFAHRRGTPFVMSAKDWALMKKWHDEQIPLPLILEAIDFCFDKHGEGGRRRTISSLSYCRHAVKDLWEERRSLAVGEGSSVPEAGPGPRLEALAGALDAARVETPVAVEKEIAALARAVRALPPSDSVPNIESSLLDLEEQFFERFLAVLGSEASSSFEREVDLMLAGSRPLDEAMLKKTRTANLRRLLRERFRLPRLSLFG